MTDAPFVAAAYLVTMVALAIYVRSLRARLRVARRLTDRRLEADRAQRAAPSGPLSGGPEGTHGLGS